MVAEARPVQKMFSALGERWSVKAVRTVTDRRETATGKSGIRRLNAVARHWGGGRPGDTLQGGDTRTKKNFVAEFTKNSEQTRSDR